MLAEVGIQLVEGDTGFNHGIGEPLVHMPDAVKAGFGVLQETCHEFVEVGLRHRTFQPGKPLGIEFRGGTSAGHVRENFSRAASSGIRRIAEG